MRVVIAGASGFLGSSLVDELRVRGHEVTRLVRRPPADPHESEWDPGTGRLDRELVERADVVVTLNGSSLLGNPHSGAHRQRIRDSRVQSTRLLAEAVAASERRPALVAANGSAWYGDHGAEVVTEESDSRGDAFMTTVAREWQEATTSASEAGARVCVLRTVPVMAEGSLVFDVVLPVFRLWLGGRLGDGSQHFPVVSLRDWVGAVTYLAESPDLSGPFNICAPTTSTNAEFTDVLARRLGRKAVLPAPAPLLRTAAGPMAPELLGSYNLRPAALERAGFEFQDPDVEAVLATGLA
jgi:uncharacterized protein (TIGR01777 family)